MTQKEKLKAGFTTGTCAQAAAKAASFMLINKRVVESVDVETPKGMHLNLKVIDQKIGKNFAQCAVVKDAGDDPDVTDCVRIYAKVKYSNKRGVSITGGAGVGKITKPGLALSVGEWAINPVPRKMIFEEVSSFLPAGRGMEVAISVPGGEELAKRTFNPRLGIVGGISIIGTTGIVEPKSLNAYKTSLALELDVLKAGGYNKSILVLGYVGEKFCKETLGLKDDSVIKIGDHIGFMLEQCVKKDIEEVILIGHIGKLIKVANGQFDTNCRFGDERINMIARYAKDAGAGEEVIRDILKQAAAEATIEILKRSKYMGVFKKIARDVSQKARSLTGNKLRVDCIILSLNAEELARS